MASTRFSVSPAVHARRVPTVFPATSVAAGEAVISYGAAPAGIAQQVARTLDKILKGTLHGDFSSREFSSGRAVDVTVAARVSASRQLASYRSASTY